MLLTRDALRISIMRVRIREASEADGPRWLELRCALWPGSDAEHAAEIASFFEGKLAEPECVLVAESGAEAAMVIVGIAELSVRPRWRELQVVRLDTWRGCT